MNFLSYLLNNWAIFPVLALIIIVFAFILLLFYRFKRKQASALKESLANSKKIRVVIRQAPKDEEHYVEPTTTSDGLQFFVMEKPDEEIGGWKFTAPDGSIRIDAQGRPYVEVYRGATTALAFNYTDKTLEQPHWNKDESKRFLTAEALIRRYGKQVKEFSSLKTWLMITMIIVIVVAVIAGYNAYQVSQLHTVASMAATPTPTPITVPPPI